MTSQDRDEIVKSIIRTDLAEGFAGKINFDPIVVLHMVDDLGDGDGSNYLRILIVHDGKRPHLDPSWTSGLIRRIRPKLIENGIEEFPSPEFIGKSEWLSMYPKWKRLHPEVVVETG